MDPTEYDTEAPVWGCDEHEGCIPDISLCRGCPRFCCGVTLAESPESPDARPEPETAGERA
jgi:hypothetical protein